MKTIYKYELNVTDEQTLSLPKNHKVLTVMVQNGIPCIWVLLDPEQREKEDLDVFIFGTGQMIPEFATIERLTYLGSFMIVNDNFVGHVYYKNQNSICSPLV